MKHVELIFFDLDGTLVDSKEAISKGINFALQKSGLKQKSIAEIASYIGTGVDDLVKKSLGPGHQQLFEQTKFAFENYRKDCPDGSHLYSGTKEVLEHFRDKKKLIVTNRKYEYALPTLKRLNIADYFEDIIGADDQNCLKPSPCPLQNAMKRLNVEKEKSIIVGDMYVDILAGKQAGIATCCVTYGIGKKEDILKLDPDFVIDDILELRKIIN